MGRERAVAFVVARLGSHRLAEKHFRAIGDRALLDWVVAGLRRSTELDEVVIATTAEPENDALEVWAHAAGLACYRYVGDPEAVTTRLRRAAEELEAELCVLVSGDCPLIDAVPIDRALAALRETPEADVADLRREGADGLLSGLGIARRRGWQLADDLSTRPELARHQFPVIAREEHRFRVVRVPLPDAYHTSAPRLSIDTWADLELHRELVARLDALGRPYALLEAAALLEEEPELASRNAHVHQLGVSEDPGPALFAIDAGGGRGFGHLMRCRELALQLTERTGRASLFLVDDEEAARCVEAVGLRVRWGSLAGAPRPAPAGRETWSAEEAARGAELVVVDLAADRELVAGWRSAFEAPVAVLDRADGWALEADLIVIPGVTGPTAPARTGPRVLAGAGALILRREVRREAAAESERDVLVYLHAPERRASARALAERAGLSVDLVDAPAEDFARRLARSRVFLSGFGVACYEALAVGTRPVVWPHSPAHERDARRFFEAFGLSPALVANENELADVLVRAVADSGPLPEVADGTGRIVLELDALVRGDRERTLSAAEAR